MTVAYRHFPNTYYRPVCLQHKTNRHKPLLGLCMFRGVWNTHTNQVIYMVGYIHILLYLFSIYICFSHKIHIERKVFLKKNTKLKSPK